MTRTACSATGCTSATPWPDPLLRRDPQRLVLAMDRVLQPRHHLLRHHLPELRPLDRPVVQDRGSPGASGLAHMLGDQTAQLVVIVPRLDPLPQHALGIGPAGEA